MQSERSQIAVTPQQKNTLRMSAIVLEAREWLLNSVSGMVPRYEDAEDIVQDVFHQFTGAYGELRSLEAASAWLYRTARNKVSDFYRRRARTLEGSHNAVQSGDIEDGQFLENFKIQNCIASPCSNNPSFKNDLRQLLKNSLNCSGKYLYGMRLRD